MKKNITTLLIVLLVSAVAIAQKSELKSADKALKKGDVSGAEAALKSAEPLIANADYKYKTQYYFLKGKMYFDMAKKQMNTFESFDKASEAFKALLEMEASGKKKYTEQVMQMKSEGANILLQGAQASYRAKDLKAAAKGFEKTYRLSPTDTAYLYNAALLSYIDKDYDTALKYYQELKDDKYTGVGIEYYATNKETGKEEILPSEQQRDLYVKLGTYVNPGERKIESKRADIIKNIAYIYIQQGKKEEALKAFAEARKESPDDANLIIEEAKIYGELGDEEKYKSLILDAVAKQPDNASLHNAVGFFKIEEKKYEEARETFKKALSVDPKFVNAKMGLASTYISAGDDLIEEMNSLGNSRADTKKYNELKAKREDLYKQGVQVLEGSLKDHQGNKQILEQLKNIYAALGDTENFRRIKDMME